jgi:8-oxo-dGTP diphosphatase
MIDRQKREAVVAIIRKSNRFLVVKRSDYKEAAKGYWCPVSGGIENNESQEDTLKREVMEEVGLEVSAQERICGILSHDNNSFLNYWTVNIISGEASITSNEATDLRWVTLEEMRQLAPIFQEDIEILSRLEFDETKHSTT